MKQESYAMPARFSYLITLVFCYGIFLLCAIFLGACDNNSNQTDSDNPNPLTDTPDTIQLVFTYDGEKKTWINKVTTQFNTKHYQISNGQAIHVKAVPMSSVKLIDEILSETRRAHLISPASSAFIKLGNTKSQLKTDNDMVGYTENLVLSPIVIALWKPMVEILNWDKQSVGWADILAFAKKPQGWAAYQYPQWGRFKLGHPHPEYSNSGLLSLFAQIYAGTDKLSYLTVADIISPDIAAHLHNIQQIVSHYGQSSQFFLDELHNKGPKYLSAAILYENQVIQSYQYRHSSIPLVAVYPKEGTLWSEHPIGIVKRDWVTPSHYEAAQIYINYLLDKPQQKKALQDGFRPANVRVPLASPIDMIHGVDPSAPKVALEMPSVDVIKAIINLWPPNKKPANIVLMLDTSGGMRGDKIRHVRQTALQVIERLKDVDYLSLLSFNHRFSWVAKYVPVGSRRKMLQRQIKYLFASGGTALYDAIEQAYGSLLSQLQSDKISALVVLTDGGDSHSQLSFKYLLNRIQFDSEASPIRIFTIGYGSEVEKQQLKEIARISEGQFYDGSVLEINTIVRNMATFF